MRFYAALCALIEAAADLATARAEYVRTPDEPEEPVPNGADAMVERWSQYEPAELNIHHNRDESELYEDRIGFNLPKARKP